MPSKVTMSFGQATKNDKNIPMQEVRSLGLVGRDITTGLKLNGTVYTNKKESYQFGPEVHFAEDEFINCMEVVEQSDGDKPVVDIRFKTNKEHTINLTSSKGINYWKSKSNVHYKRYSNIKVLKVGGSIAQRMSTLRVNFVQDYVETMAPKTEMLGEGTAVISVFAAFTTFTTFESSEANRLHAATRVQNSIFAMGVETSASVSGGFAKASFEASISASISKEKETSEEIHDEVQTTNKSSITRTREVPEGYIGLEVVRVQLMKTTGTSKDGEEDTFNWMFPIGESQMVTIPTTTKLPTGLYDLTGALMLAMPDATNRMGIMKGFTCVGKE